MGVGKARGGLCCWGPSWLRPVCQDVPRSMALIAHSDAESGSSISIGPGDGIQSGSWEIDSDAMSNSTESPTLIFGSWGD